MSISNAVDITRVPGRLCFSPTDLSIAYPHGGTSLGVVKSLTVKPFRTDYKVTAEEFGNEIVDYIKGGESWVIGAILRSFDKDALAKLFPSSKTGAQTQETLIQHPSETVTVRAGNLLSTNGVKLLFSPDDTIRNKFVLFYNAIPLIEETALMNFEIDLDWSIGMLWAGIRDGSSPAKVMAMGFKGDFSL